MAESKRLNIRQIEDKEDALTVIRSPDIFPHIAGNSSVSPDDFDVDLGDEFYVGGYVKGKIVGLMIYHIMDNEWRCHFQVLPEYRKDYADEFAKDVLNWFWSRVNVDILVAYIPEKYQNVLKFAVKHGFQEIELEGGKMRLELMRPEKWDLLKIN